MGKEFEEEFKDFLGDEFDWYYEELINDADIVSSRTNVEIVFCLDLTTTVTEQLKPFFESLFNNINDCLKHKNKLPLEKIKIKLVGFGDIKNNQNIKESRFFSLPDESNELLNEIDKFTPEKILSGYVNALNGLMSAMGSEWEPPLCITEKKRNIIVVITENTTYTTEKSYIIENFETEELFSLYEICDAWQGAGPLGYYDRLSDYRMDAIAKRLLLYTPDEFPWDDLLESLEYSIHRVLEKNECLNLEGMLKDIGSAISS